MIYGMCICVYETAELNKKYSSARAVNALMRHRKSFIFHAHVLHIESHKFYFKLRSYLKNDARISYNRQFKELHNAQ